MNYKQYLYNTFETEEMFLLCSSEGANGSMRFRFGYPFRPKGQGCDGFSSVPVVLEEMEIVIQILIHYRDLWPRNLRLLGNQLPVRC
jgi:hypothetical protein